MTVDVSQLREGQRVRLTYEGVLISNGITRDLGLQGSEIYLHPSTVALAASVEVMPACVTGESSQLAVLDALTDIPNRELIWRDKNVITIVNFVDPARLDRATLYRLRAEAEHLLERVNDALKRDQS